MTTFSIKVGDTAPALRAILLGEDGKAEALTDLDVVTFRMRPELDGLAPPIVDASAVKVDKDAGVVEYQWSGGDTDKAGAYLAEFHVRFEDLREKTFPNGREYVRVEITPHA